MSSNTDNAMTRFLFAILRQCNLKTIDWNQVAHDPILSQGITNGHAARMRYSRFRSAMLGLEPTRRNRTGPPKPRATKPKKDAKTKTDDAVKSEPTATEAMSAAGAESAPPTPQERAETPAPKIKQEAPHRGSEPPYLSNRLTPSLTPAPMPAPQPSSSGMTATPQSVQQRRLLTPCSDTDVFVPAPASASPAPSDMISPQGAAAFHFSQPPCPGGHDDMAAWTPTMSYAVFPRSPCVYDDFRSVAAADCDHMYHHPHDLLGLQFPSVEMDGDPETMSVKHEGLHEDFEPYP